MISFQETADATAAVAAPAPHLQPTQFRLSRLTFSASVLAGAGEAAGALLHSMGSGGVDSDSTVDCSASSPGVLGTTIFSLSASEFSTGPVTPGTSSACRKKFVKLGNIVD